MGSLDLRSRLGTAPASPRHVRVLSALLVLALSFLAGLAVWSGFSAGTTTNRLERSAEVLEAYLDLHHAVAVQDANEDERSAGAPQRFDRAGVQIGASLAAIAANGTAADRRLSRQIGVRSEAYSAAVSRVQRALEAGDEKQAEKIDDAEVDVLSPRLKSLVNQSGPEQAQATLHTIRALRGSQQLVLRSTLLVVGLGLLMLSGLWLALRRLRRRFDDATDAELSRLAQAALTDSLTGLRNHRAFREDLTRELARNSRQGGAQSLVMLDVVGLKQINNTSGHQAGDRRLRAVAAALTSTARASDSVYRVGGDEFAALLPATSAWEAFQLAQRLHRELDAAGTHMRAGIAEAGNDAGPDQLVRGADLALVEAKRAGTGTVIYTAALTGDENPPAERESDSRQAPLAAALARAVDAKDSYTRSHCETVAELSSLIAIELELPASAVAQIRLAALVHDVGKIGIPDGILQKPGRLTDAEFETIKTHSTLGHHILQGTALSGVAPWVLHHHERIDGRGYPHGLMGAQIPLESRIILVADAFEAMTSDRPYRAGVPDKAAIAELEHHSGTQFDPECVQALLRALGQKLMSSPGTMTSMPA